MDPLILFKLEQGKASSDLQSIQKLTHMKKYNKIIMNENDDYGFDDNNSSSSNKNKH